jgi:hypothetical protein
MEFRHLQDARSRAERHGEVLAIAISWLVSTGLLAGLVVLFTFKGAVLHPWRSRDCALGAGVSHDARGSPRGAGLLRLAVLSTAALLVAHLAM